MRETIHTVAWSYQDFGERLRLMCLLLSTGHGDDAIRRRMRALRQRHALHFVIHVLRGLSMGQRLELNNARERSVRSLVTTWEAQDLDTKRLQARVLLTGTLASGNFPLEITPSEAARFRRARP